MAQANSKSPDEPSRHILDVIFDKIVAVLLAIRGSFLTFMMALGVVLFASGFVVDAAGNYGAVAAMLIIWGATLFGYGLIGHVTIRLIGYR